jgi:hypothetical protein
LELIVGSIPDIVRDDPLSADVETDQIGDPSCRLRRLAGDPAWASPPGSSAERKKMGSVMPEQEVGIGVGAGVSRRSSCGDLTSSQEA